MLTLRPAYINHCYVKQTSGKLSGCTEGMHRRGYTQCVIYGYKLLFIPKTDDIFVNWSIINQGLIH